MLLAAHGRIAQQRNNNITQYLVTGGRVELSRFLGPFKMEYARDDLVLTAVVVVLW